MFSKQNTHPETNRVVVSCARKALWHCRARSTLGVRLDDLQELGANASAGSIAHRSMLSKTFHKPLIADAMECQDTAKCKQQKWPFCARSQTHSQLHRMPRYSDVCRYTTLDVRFLLAFFQYVFACTSKSILWAFSQENGLIGFSSSSCQTNKSCPSSQNSI